MSETPKKAKRTHYLVWKTPGMGLSGLIVCKWCGREWGNWATRRDRRQIELEVCDKAPVDG